MGIDAWFVGFRVRSMGTQIIVAVGMIIRVSNQIKEPSSRILRTNSPCLRHPSHQYHSALHEGAGATCVHPFMGSHHHTIQEGCS